MKKNKFIILFIFGEFRIHLNLINIFEFYPCMIGSVQTLCNSGKIDNAMNATWTLTDVY